MCIRDRLSGGHNFLIGGVQPAVADIVGDGPGKQVGILDYHGKGTPQVILFDVPDINAVVGNCPAVNLIKPVDQIDNGGFSRTGRSHKGDLLPRLGVQADIPQHLFMGRCV